MNKIERLRRTELAVPGSSRKMVESAAASDADEVFLDLEDSVAPSMKEPTRAMIVRALQELDWTGKVMSVRINGLETHLAYRDLIEVVEPAGQYIDTIMVPKVRTPEDVYFVDTMLTQIEEYVGIQKRIGIEAQIENGVGLVNVEEIAFASDRLETIVFGPGDFAASVGVPNLSIGAHKMDYPGHIWHYAMSRIIAAARAAGLQAMDGPFGSYANLEGVRASAQMARTIGFDGKWAVHPAQIDVIHEVFTASEQLLQQADAFAKRYQRATEEEGLGAVALDGEMIDAASVRMVNELFRRSRLIERAGKGRRLERKAA
jgi:citrate lyase subunit beta / citryl-CoA lyase